MTIVNEDPGRQVFLLVGNLGQLLNLSVPRFPHL